MSDLVGNTKTGFLASRLKYCPYLCRLFIYDFFWAGVSDYVENKETDFGPKSNLLQLDWDYFLFKQLVIQRSKYLKFWCIVPRNFSLIPWLFIPCRYPKPSLKLVS